MTSKLLMIPKTVFNPRFHPTTRELELLNSVVKFEQNTDSKTFTLHEAPLSVHGKLHFGHFYNKIHKDILKRYKLLQGYQITPSIQFELFGPQIEHAAFQQLAEKGTTSMQYDEKTIRNVCSQYAESQLKQYLATIKRWGILEQEIGVTINPQYQKQILYQFARFLELNSIFRQYKVIVWSVSRFSEVSFDSIHITKQEVPGNAIKLKFTTLNKSFQKLKCAIYLVMEMPNPWKLPNVKAIQLQDQEWLVLKDKDAFVMTKDFFNTHKEEFSKHQLVGTIETEDFQDLTLDNGIDRYQKFRIIIGEENNIVCPAHQMDDIPLAKKYSLNREGIVNENGKLLYENQEFDILNGEANQLILQELRDDDRVIDVVSSTKEVMYHHKITGEQLILRSVPAWFIKFDEKKIAGYKNLQNIKDDLTEEERPNRKKDQIYTSYLELMESLCGQWCITDQNIWGIPLPLFFATEQKQFQKLNHGYLLDEEIVKHFADLVEVNGSDIYWTWNIVDLLPEKYKIKAQYLEKHNSVLSPSFGLPKQSDMIYEGIDQNEAFIFNSQMLAMIAQKKLCTNIKLHPTLQINKDKMSKSNSFNLENVIEGQIKANEAKQYGSGVDVLRALVTVIDMEDEFNQQMLDKKKEQINFVRKVYWQIIGCLENSSITPVELKDLKFIDSYIYQQLILFVVNISRAYDEMNFKLAYELYIDFMQDYVQPYVTSTRAKLIAFNQEYKNSLYIYFKLYDVTLNVIQPILCFNARDIHSKLSNSWPKIPVTHFQESQDNIVSLSLLHKVRKGISYQINEVQQRIKQKNISKKLEIVFIIEPNSFEEQLLDFARDQLALFLGCGQTQFETEFLNKKRPNHLCLSSFYIREQFYHQKIHFQCKFYQIEYDECPRCLEHKSKNGLICNDCSNYIEIEEQKTKQLS